jgi:predicted transcriptional regulator
MRSITSSFRMSPELRKRLEETARTLKKRKNWIIIQALEEYLQKRHRAALAAEARRQSLLASSESAQDEGFWGSQTDARGWE